MGLKRLQELFILDRNDCLLVVISSPLKTSWRLLLLYSQNLIVFLQNVVKLFRPSRRLTVHLIDHDGFPIFVFLRLNDIESALLKPSC